MHCDLYLDSNGLFRDANMQIDTRTSNKLESLTICRSTESNMWLLAPSFKGLRHPFSRPRLLRSHRAIQRQPRTPHRNMPRGYPQVIRRRTRTQRGLLKNHKHYLRLYEVTHTSPTIDRRSSTINVLDAQLPPTSGTRFFFGQSQTS